MATLEQFSDATKTDPQELTTHISALERYALKLTKNVTQAEDLVQTSLERALSRLKQYQMGTNMKSWLFTIMHNEFIDEVRRVARRGHQVEIEDWQESASTPQMQEKSLEMRDFERAFNQLEATEQELLRLVSVEGKTYDQLSNIFDVEIGTIKSRLFRTREKLRAIQERVNSNGAKGSKNERAA
ncbi:MAG: sigma-70 family RNA polymerase sigma factor [Rhodospirillaceae bacterium]